MRKVKALQRFSYHGGFIEVGQVVEVENNDAFGLTESGVAELFAYENRQMLPENRKGRGGKYRAK